ncbi:response regulator [Paenibacillus sp. OV219]|uniref:response regulator transcription factor n=1 Tax=Paenibacillus sp. OV219 TaxID=1884377 RepID=UPI0008D67614|nr:response regulator [Paenibacillus sp. OV219]SEO05115.1 two component transcriptional regulator, AraC family [Paenibacillus sp. OV219]
MYSLLIVDDEEFVREGLRKFVEWDKLGYRVVYDADSAEKALEIMEQECIETVLTDIMMPDIDGLELIGEINKRYPDIITVILSGFGEFEYAQRALRLGAVDYLTKPVNFAEINRVFGMVNEMLERKKQSRTMQADYYRFMTEQLLNNLVKGSFNDEQLIRKKAETLQLELPIGDYRLLRVHLSGANAVPAEPSISDKQASQDQKTQAIQLLAAFLQPFGVCHVFNNDIREVSAILFTNEDNSRLEIVMRQLQEELSCSLGCTIHIGLGRGYNDIMHAKKSYDEAGKALEYLVFKKQSGVLGYDEVARFFTEQSVVTDEAKNVILSYLSQADSASLIAHVQSILEDMALKAQTNSPLIHNSCIEIMLIVNKFAHHSADETGIGTSAEERNSFTIKQLMQLESIDEIMQFMEHYITVSMEKLGKVRKKTTGRIIDYAMKYITEHFCEEITLSKLSEVLFVHPVYISRLFKEELGENFVDYLKKVRIEKSKELLSNLSLKVYEVSEMIGYDSPKYFSKLFKEITGITPKEYQDHHAAH